MASCDCTICGMTRGLQEIRTLVGSRKRGRFAKIRAALNDIEVAYNVHLDEDCERDMELAALQDFNPDSVSQ